MHAKIQAYVESIWYVWQRVHNEEACKVSIPWIHSTCTSMKWLNHISKVVSMLVSNTRKQKKRIFLVHPRYSQLTFFCLVSNAGFPVTALEAMRQKNCWKWLRLSHPLKVWVLVLAWFSVEQASNHTWNGGMVGAPPELHRHSDNVNYCIDNVQMYGCQPSIHLTISSYVNISFSSQVFSRGC